MNSRRLAYLIVIFASAICSSCGIVKNTIKYAKSDYNEWKKNKRIEAFSNYELPPEDQYLFCVDTIHLKNPVIISETTNRWIIDAPEKPLNDDIIKSSLADSVKYIDPGLFDPTFFRAKSKKFIKQQVNFFLIWKCDFKKSPEESSEKYTVFRFIDQPKGFLLALVNACFFAKRTASQDVESRIDHMLKDYTNCYVPVLYPLGPQKNSEYTEEQMREMILKDLGY